MSPEQIDDVIDRMRVAKTVSQRIDLVRAIEQAATREALGRIMTMLRMKLQQSALSLWSIGYNDAMVDAVATIRALLEKEG